VFFAKDWLENSGKVLERIRKRMTEDVVV